MWALVLRSWGFWNSDGYDKAKSTRTLAVYSAELQLFKTFNKTLTTKTLRSKSLKVSSLSLADWAAQTVSTSLCFVSISLPHRTITWTNVSWWFVAKHGLMVYIVPKSRKSRKEMSLCVNIQLLHAHGMENRAFPLAFYSKAGLC